MTDDCFTVYSQGDYISGYVNFWRTGNRYFYNAIETHRCSKALYDKAKRISDNQKKGDYSERI